jgi:hypothetical protein
MTVAMKANRIHAFGGAEVILFEDAPPNARYARGSGPTGIRLWPEMKEMTNEAGLLISQSFG